MSSHLSDTLAQRPRSVIVAVVCLAISLAMAPITWIFTARWDLPSAWAIFFGICVLLWLNVTALYHGRNWVRWLNVCLIVIGLVSVFEGYAIQHTLISKIRYVTQTMLQAIALVCLLFPGSGLWYSRVVEARRLRKRDLA
jgi:hypothetical protein